MKKAIALIVVIGCLLVAGVASASSVEGTGVIGSGTNTLTVVTSSNVRITYTAADQSYGAKGEHKAGNRAYGTGSGTPGIFYIIKVAGEWSTTSVGSDFTGSGWTAQ